MVFYPKRKFCPSCLEQTTDTPLSGFGEIISFTTIHTAPSGFEKQVPYTIAIIKLEEGPQLTAQIIGSESNIVIGKKVRAVYRIISKYGDVGLINYGYKFELVE